VEALVNINIMSNIAKSNPINITTPATAHAFSINRFTKALDAETEHGITFDVYTHSDANTDANVALWVQQSIGVVL
jgi:hypothetical protein